jgi:hypothetical protein
VQEAMSRLRCWAGSLCLLTLVACGGDHSKGRYVSPAVPEASRARWNDDGTLSFALGGQSAAEVAVVTPDKRFVMLASADFLCQGVSREGGRLRIDPSEATGYYWNAEGRKEEVVAFAQVGAYEVLVADNLESELDGTESVMTMRMPRPMSFRPRVPATP